MFFDKVAEGLRPIQGYEDASGSATAFHGSALPFVIPSGADLSRRAVEGSAVLFTSNQSQLETPPSPLSSRPERSGATSVLTLILGNVFRQSRRGPAAPSKAMKTSSIPAIALPCCFPGILTSTRMQDARKTVIHKTTA
jgi:hypothetical protein